jgi:hypothetical protein
MLLISRHCNNRPVLIINTYIVRYEVMYEGKGKEDIWGNGGIAPIILNLGTKVTG